jgi:hypothetical protein
MDALVGSEFAVDGGERGNPGLLAELLKLRRKPGR